jgi:hypothetical protein
MYVAEDVEEGHIMLRKSAVQHAVMEKQPESKHIHGELRIFVGKDFAKRLIYILIN